MRSHGTQMHIFTLHLGQPTLLQVGAVYRGDVPCASGLSSRPRRVDSEIQRLQPGGQNMNI